MHEFIQHIVTRDETLVYEFDMQNTQLIQEWRLPFEPKRKKNRQSRPKVNMGECAVLRNGRSYLEVIQ